MANRYEIEITAKDNTGRVLGKIERDLKNLGASSGGVNNVSGSIRGLGAAGTAARVGVAALAVAVGATTRAIIQAGAEYQNYNNRLRLVTNGSADLADTMVRLQDLAVQNRTSLADTVDLYSKLRIATEDLGYSTSEVEQLTTKMSQALAVAGADAGTASGVIRQFGQAMASGVVRGDEFNSIVEGLGPALAIMARESGVTVGQLREMAGNGELTAQKFSELLLNSNALTESFNKMQPTLDQVQTKLGDAMSGFLNEVNEALGLTEKWTGFLNEAADAVSSLGKAVQITFNPTPLQEAASQIQMLSAGMGDLSKVTDPSQLMRMQSVLEEITFQTRLMNEALQEGRTEDAAGIKAYIDQIRAGNPELKTNNEALQRAVRNFMALEGAQFAAAESARLAAQAQREQAEAARQVALEEQLMSQVVVNNVVSLTEQRKAILDLLDANSGYRTELQSQRAEITQMDAAVAAINYQLNNNTTITAAQREELTAMRDAIASARSELWNYGETMALAGEHTANAMRTIEQERVALSNNATEYNNLISQIQVYNERLRASGGESEFNRRMVELLSAALAENRAEYARLSGDVDGTSASLSQFEQYYKQLLETANATVTSQENMSRAVSQLNTDLANGVINIDQFAAAMSNLNQVSVPTFDQKLQGVRDRIGAMQLENTTNQQLVETLTAEGYTRQQLIDVGLIEREVRRSSTRAKQEELTASQQLAKSLGEEKARWDNLNSTLANTSAIEALAKQYGVSADIITRELTRARDAITTFQTESVTITGIIKNTWDEMSKSMASSIANGIMEGKGAFNSFADFLKDFSKRIVSQILEKMLIQPMINQMTNWMGLTSGAVPTIAQQFGGMGGGMGFGGMLSGLWGGISGMFSGLWGGISGFFGNLFGGFFADGGYLPAGKVGVVGEAGPELITGPANITPMDDTGGGITVNFNINAIDTQSGTEFIMKNKQQITGVIQDAYNRRGRQGVY